MKLGARSDGWIGGEEKRFLSLGAVWGRSLAGFPLSQSAYILKGDENNKGLSTIDAHSHFNEPFYVKEASSTQFAP